jgi:hypothetical protein
MDLANGTYLNCTAAGNSSDCTSGLYYDYQVGKTSLNCGSLVSHSYLFRQCLWSLPLLH